MSIHGGRGPLYKSKGKAASPPPSITELVMVEGFAATCCKGSRHATAIPAMLSPGSFQPAQRMRDWYKPFLNSANLLFMILIKTSVIRNLLIRILQGCHDPGMIGWP